MRRRSRTAIHAATLVVLAASSVSAASFTVDQWALGPILSRSSPYQRVEQTDSQARSPFQDTHMVSIPPSSVQAEYDFHYSQSFGRFLIESSINALGGPPLTSTRAQAIGTIVVSTDDPLATTLDASFDYVLPPVSMDAGVWFRVYDADDPGPLLFGGAQSDTSWTGEGAAGTITFNDATVLPGGHTYWIQFGTDVNTSGGPQNAIGAGNGYIDFTLQALPEPATATLLLCALPLLRHRRTSAGRFRP